MFDAVHAEVNASSSKDRPAKRLRSNPNRGVKNPAATGAQKQPGDAKRARIMPKSPETTDPSKSSHGLDSELLTNVVNQIENILPRVGKRQIDSPNIFNMIQQLFPNMVIHKVVACEGTDRRWGPPQGLSAEEAPYRRSLMKLRESKEISADSLWEKYDTFS